jgi:hypothetical protein
MRGAAFINKHTHPELTGHRDAREQAVEAKEQFQAMLKGLQDCVPTDLDRV